MAEDNNSLRRADRPSFEERRKDLKVFSGVRQVKRKDSSSVWTWIARMFFSGRKPKDILKDVLKNEVVPSVQDGVYNSVVSFAGKAIYKEDRKLPSTGSYTPSGSFITNYVSYGEKKAQNKAALEETKKQEEETIRSGYETPAFENLEQAKQFLKNMHGYMEKYDNMSVQDLAWMQGKTIDYTWDKYGWSREEILSIKEPVRFGTPVIVEDAKGNKIRLTHFIGLPKAHEL